RVRRVAADRVAAAGLEALRGADALPVEALAQAQAIALGPGQRGRERLGEQELAEHLGEEQVGGQEVGRAAGRQERRRHVEADAREVAAPGVQDVVARVAYDRTAQRGLIHDLRVGEDRRDDRGLLLAEPVEQLDAPAR